MKFGTREIVAVPVPGVHGAAAVGVNVRQFGLQLLSERIAPDEARQFAAELILAANVAQGVIAAGCAR